MFEYHLFKTLTDEEKIEYINYLITIDKFKNNTL